jgi:hypothetical protein
MKEHEPEIATTYGTFHDLAYYSSSEALPSYLLSGLARSYNRLAAKAEPMFSTVYPTHDLDTVFGTASSPKQSALHLQPVSIDSWQLVCAPIHCPKKPGLSRMYVKLYYVVSAPSALQTKTMDIQVITSKTPRRESLTGLTLSNVTSIASTATAAELVDIEMSSGPYETVYLYAKSRADNEPVYNTGTGAMGVDNGTILGAKDTSTLLLSSAVAIDPATGYSFATAGCYIRIVHPTTNIDLMPPRTITGIDDGAFFLDQYVTITPQLTDSEMRRITQSNAFAATRVNYKICMIPRLQLRAWCGVGMARTK